MAYLSLSVRGIGRFLIRKYFKSPSVPFMLEKGKYIIKTATTPQERRAAFQLRYRVFYQEYRNQPTSLGIDKDPLDDIADLLIIKDGDSGQVIGTYRAICSSYFQQNYSSQEFRIEPFLALPGTKVELSRACIDPHYRKGSVIYLLWRGIYEYLRLVEADYLYGLSSMKIQDYNQLFRVIQYFISQDHAYHQQMILPQPDFDMSSQILSNATQEPSPKDHLDLPPLLRAYLNVGAKVAVVPAYDRFFQCYDFFTVLDVKSMNSSLVRKFGKERNTPWQATPLSLSEV